MSPISPPKGRPCQILVIEYIYPVYICSKRFLAINYHNSSLNVTDVCLTFPGVYQLWSKRGYDATLPLSFTFNLNKYIYVDSR